MSTWQPIEAAPRDGVLIVVTGNNYGKSEQGHHFCLATFMDGEWREHRDQFAYYDETTLHYLTHWMPLPPHPSAEPKTIPREQPAAILNNASTEVMK